MKTPIVAITGMPGSGKSEFCSVLSHAYAHAIDADKVGYAILGDQMVMEQLSEVYGEDIISEGKIVRAKLAERAFQEGQNEALNAITHPAIKDEIKGILQAALPFGEYYVLEAALLFEASFEDLAFLTVHIESSFDTRLSRVTQHRAWSKQELERRDSFQNSGLKNTKADIVVHNMHSVEDFIKKALELDIALRYNMSCDSGLSDLKKSVIHHLKSQFSWSI